jgi:ACS family tartrate transporter-like MFS transporter
VLFQVPSNLLLSRLGAKLWLPLITAAFGTVAVCSALFIRGPASFYALRLALGVTEAGGSCNEVLYRITKTSLRCDALPQ